MRKNIKLIIAIIAIAFTLSILCTSVKAGTVSTIEVTTVTTGITVSGTTAEDVQAVAIAVYNEAGTELVAMTTTEVNDSNVYSDTIAVANGTYLVKVADYAGGTFVTKIVTVSESTTTEGQGNTEQENATEVTTDSSKTVSPKTGDTILMYVGIMAVAVIAFGGVIIARKN